MGALLHSDVLPLCSRQLEALSRCLLQRHNMESALLPHQFQDAHYAYGKRRCPLQAPEFRRDAPINNVDSRSDGLSFLHNLECFGSCGEEKCPVLLQEEVGELNPEWSQNPVDQLATCCMESEVLLCQFICMAIVGYMFPSRFLSEP